MRGRLAALAAAVIWAGAASADPPGDDSAFWKALDRRDGLAMIEAYNATLDARIGALRGPDPILDAMTGALLGSLQFNRPASSYLRRALATTSDVARRERIALEIARHDDVAGESIAAEAAYRQLLKASGSDIRRLAGYAAGRLTLGRSPDDAAALLTAAIALADTPGERWEGNLHLSRALALGGHPADASAALARAWAEAPSAPFANEAVVRTARDMMIDAPSRDAQAALLGSATPRLSADSAGPPSCPCAAAASSPMIG